MFVRLCIYMVQFSANGTLPGEERKRHCPVIGSYSWFSSEHRHRKEPSTFSQRASPHTPLSISHSFTSVKLNIQTLSFIKKVWVSEWVCYYSSSLCACFVIWKMRLFMYLKHLHSTFLFGQASQGGSSQKNTVSNMQPSNPYIYI